jgi:hypothetical protein
MKCVTLLKTTVAASIALASLMAMTGCVWRHDDRHDDWDHRDDHPNYQDNHQDDHPQNGPAYH